MKKILVVVILATSLLADTIELKTGERIEGLFKQATSAGAVIEVGGHPITISMEKVSAIYFGTVAVASTPSPEQLKAIEAIEAIRSVAKAGVSYRDYAPRVLDAKVQVDRFVNSTQGTPKLRYAVKGAMEFYNLASRAWNARLFSRDAPGSEQIAIGKEVKESLLFNACLAFRDRINVLKAGSNYPPDDVNTLRDIGKDLGKRIDLLWGCASIRVIEAEALTGKTE